MKKKLIWDIKSLDPNINPWVDLQVRKTTDLGLTHITRMLEYNVTTGILQIHGQRIEA